MKHYKKLARYTVFLIVGAAIIAGCNRSYLTPKPLSIYTPDNTYNTPVGLQAAVEAAGKNLWYENNGSPAPYQAMMQFTDEMVNGATDATPGKDYANNLSPDDASLNPSGSQSQVSWYWTQVYAGIKYANTIVTYIDVPKWDTTQTAQRAQRNSLLGQAYFWRAYYYYYLTNSFGDVPWVGKLYSAPKLDFRSTSRTTILQQIKADLQYASNWVTDGGAKGLTTKGAVLHLLAKVQLALGDFSGAVATTTKLISSGPYKLMTTRFGINASDATKNVLWDLHRPENKSIAANTEGLLMAVNRESVPGNIGTNSWMRNYMPYWSHGNNTPAGNVGTSDVVGIAIDQDTQFGRGVAFGRLTWYSTHLVWGSAAGISSTGDLRHSLPNWMRMEDLVYNNPALLTTKPTADPYYGKPMQKYSASGALLCSDTIRSWFDWPHYKLYNFDPLQTSSQGGGYSDYYIFRLAETYLVRAEANVWLGNLSAAASDLNIIRARANAPLFPVSGAGITIATILDERSRELLMEEERRMELTRISYLFAQTGQVAPTGKTYSMSNFSTSNFWFDWLTLKNDFYNKGVVTGLGAKYTMASYNVLWPIPTSAIVGNSQGVINQNAGYTGAGSNLPPLTTITQ